MLENIFSETTRYLSLTRFISEENKLITGGNGLLMRNLFDSGRKSLHNLGLLRMAETCTLSMGYKRHFYKRQNEQLVENLEKIRDRTS